MDVNDLNPRLIRLLRPDIAIIEGFIKREDFYKKIKNEHKIRFKKIVVEKTDLYAIRALTLESELIFKNDNLPYVFHCSVASLFHTMYRYTNV